MKLLRGLLSCAIILVIVAGILVHLGAEWPPPYYWLALCENGRCSQGYEEHLQPSAFEAPAITSFTQEELDGFSRLIEQRTGSPAHGVYRIGGRQGFRHPLRAALLQFREPTADTRNSDLTPDMQNIERVSTSTSAFWFSLERRVAAFSWSLFSYLLTLTVLLALRLAVRKRDH